MPNREAANTDLIDGFGSCLIWQAKTDNVNGIARVDCNPCLALGSWLPNWVVRMDDHADVRAGRVFRR
jgi:hypothetical protein